MKYKTLIFLLIVAISAFLSGLFLPRKNILQAQSQTYTLQEINLQTPNFTILNGVSTLDGKTFYFTDNKKNFYETRETDLKPYEFNNLNNDASTSFNKGIKLRNNLSFVFTATEINQQKYYGLYKLLENGAVATTEPYQKVYENFNDEHYTYQIAQVSDMCFDYYNNFYMLDTMNKAILTLNYKNIEIHEDNKITIFKNLNFPNLQIYSELNQNSKMCLTINGKSLYIFTNNKIYKIDIETKTLSEQYTPSTTLENVLDFDCDCAGNLYFLTTNNASSTIHKFTKNGEYTCLNFDQYFEEMFIEQHDGNIFFKQENKIYKLVYEYFVASTTSFKAPLNFYQKEFLSSSAQLAIMNECSLLNSPYSLNGGLKIEENSSVIILTKLSQEPNFCYCFYEDNNETHLGYIDVKNIKESAIFVQETEQNKQTFVVTNVYKYPTRNGVKLTTIPKNTVVKILGTYEFQSANNIIDFYCVEINENNDNKIGYIAKDLVYSCTINEIEYTGGEDSPDKYNKFIEYLLILLALTILEVVSIIIIVKKVGIKKKKSND